MCAYLQPHFSSYFIGIMGVKMVKFIDFDEVDNL